MESDFTPATKSCSVLRAFLVAIPRTEKKRGPSKEVWLEFGGPAKRELVCSRLLSVGTVDKACGRRAGSGREKESARRPPALSIVPTDRETGTG